MEMQDEDALGQVEFWQLTLAFLSIPQIIHAKGQPHTLSEIITSLQAPSPDSEEVKGEAYYGLTRTSKWLVRPGTSGFAPMLTMLNHPIFLIFKYVLNNPGTNEIFNEAMARFAGLTSLVDVGGGTGTVVSAIVKVHPHNSGINFDLPHAVSSAPEHPSVVNVRGDMFISIPHADASILHDWDDDDCVKILEQCKKAIPRNSGKLIIVDAVLHPDDGTSAFADSKLAFDLLMLALAPGGKERTEKEWRALLSQGGFSKCNIISLPTLQAIIESFILLCGLHVTMILILILACFFFPFVFFSC
ncbi:hypothetical protein AMTRI_Chr02g219430 [Amborella trichopoda]